MEDSNGLTVGHELIAARLLEAVGDVDDARADYVRGAVLRLPESVSSGLLELVQAGHARDRLAYVLGSLRAELANRGLSG